MRAVSRLPLTILGALLLAHCSSSNSAPAIRVSDQRVDKANISWKDQAGNTTNITGVLPGTTTAYQSAPPGPYTVTGSVQNEANPAPVTFTAYTGGQYTVVVVDTGATPSLRIDTP